MAVSAKSVIEAIPAAFRRMALVLFQPFDAGKWFVLGFCAWLAQLGGGGGPNFNFNVGSGSGEGGDFGEAGRWVEAHLGVLILVVVVVFFVAVALGLLITWLSSRGKFMFLDGVVRNRGAVVEPWRQYRAPANSVFWFRVVFGLVMLAGLAVIGGVCLGIAWTDIAREEFGAAAFAAILVGVLCMIPYIIAIALVSAVLDDFVVPVMYLRGLRVWPAWGVVCRELVRGHVGPVLLFYLMKFVMGMAVGIVALLACCVTCCIAALPYIGTVILLPVFVFMRSYSLCFIEQYGPGWRLFAVEAAEPSAPSASLPPAGEEGRADG